VVSEARIPSLFSFLPAEKPGVPCSTMKAVTLLLVRTSPVRASITATFPLLPCVIQFLVPFSTHSSPSLVAVQRILPASLPVLASVRPQAPIHWPLASLGRYFFFCSSLPKAMICPVHRELCAATERPIEPHTLAISLMTVTYSKYPRPEPPYSAGTSTPIKPSSPIL